MTIDTERLDEAEEIYLTEDAFERWFCQENPQPHRLLVAGTPMLLHDWGEPSDSGHPSDLGEQGLIAESSYGKPAPEVRKLKRPARAVWTLFRCGCRVIALRDSGCVALNYVTDPPEGYGKPTPPTDAHAQSEWEKFLEADLWPSMDDIIRGIRSEVMAWAGSDYEQRVPAGFPRLFKRLAKNRHALPFGR